MTKLWDVYDGTPFLDNPHLFVINKPLTRRRKKVMARRRNVKGQFTKKRVRVVRMRRRSVAVVNPRRRRHVASARRVTAIRRRYHSGGRKARSHYTRIRRGTRAVIMNRRRYSHNPGFGLGALGFDKTTLNTLLYSAGGLIGTPLIENLLVTNLPAAVTGNTLGRYAVKIGSAYGLSFLAGKVLGQSIQKQVFIGGLLYTLLGAMQEFMPETFGAGGALKPGALKGMGRYYGTGAQPLLGSYQRNFLGNITAQTPGRLQPQSSY